MSYVEVNTLRTLDGTVTVDVRDLGDSTQILSRLGNQVDVAQGATLVGFRGRTLRAKLGDLISVLDYGAKGDGITNDSPAFAAAHAALPNTGGVIVAPGGRNYRLEDPVTLTKPTRIQGDGKRATSLTRTTSLSSVFFNVNSPDCSLYDFKVTAAGALVATSDLFAVNVAASSTGFIAENVIINDVASGFSMLAGDFRLNAVEVRNFRAGTGVGIRVDSGTAGDSYIVNSTARCAAGESLAGLQLLSVDGLTVTGTKSRGCGTGAIISPAAGRAVKGVDFEHCSLGSGSQGGIRFVNSGALGRIERVNVNRTACIGSTAGSGITVASGAIIYGLGITNCELFSNANGLLINDNAILYAADILNNKFAGNTSQDVAIGTNVSNWRFVGNTTGQGPGLPLSPGSLYISAGCTRFTVTANTFHVAPVDDASPAASVLIEANAGPWGNSAITFDAAPIAAGAGFTGSIPCVGAKPGDFATVSFNCPLAGLTLTAWVDSVNAVGFRLQNGTAASIDLPSAVVRARVLRA